MWISLVIAIIIIAIFIYMMSRNKAPLCIAADSIASDSIPAACTPQDCKKSYCKPAKCETVDCRPVPCKSVPCKAAPCKASKCAKTFSELPNMKIDGTIFTKGSDKTTFPGSAISVSPDSLLGAYGALKENSDYSYIVATEGAIFLLKNIEPGTNKQFFKRESYIPAEIKYRKFTDIPYLAGASGIFKDGEADRCWIVYAVGN